MDYTFLNFRRIYGADKMGAYLNTPANGLMSRRMEEELHLKIGPYLLSGSLGASYFMEELFPKVKHGLAKFINSKPENMALMPNFSFAHLALLSGVPRTTKIALLSDDYPSINTPFEQAGYDVQHFKLSHHGLNYEHLEKFLVNEKTEILALSHVQFLSGFKVDLSQISQICRSLNICIMLDVTQSIGYENIDVLGDQIDVVAGSCYKWLNAGYGTGFMSVSEKFQSKYPAKMGGFMSYDFTENGEKVFRNSMTNYEPGNLNPENYWRLLYCINEKTEIGLDNIQKHNSELLQYALDYIKNKRFDLPDNFKKEERGAFARIPGDEAMQRELEQAKVYTAARGGYLRFGCHFYNNQEDVENFLDAYLSLVGS